MTKVVWQVFIRFSIFHKMTEWIEQRSKHIKVGFNWLKNGCISVESKQHSGRSQSAQNDAVVAKGKNLVMADGRLYKRLVKRLGSVKILDLQFSMMIWTCVEWLQNLCPSCCWQNSKNSLEVGQNMLNTAITDPEFLNTNYWRWVMSIWLWPRNKSTVVVMEATHVL